MCCKKDHSLQLDSKSSSLRHLAVRPCQENVIDILKSSITTRQSKYVLNSGYDTDPEKSKLKCTQGRPFVDQQDIQGRPSEEQLERVFRSLSHHVSK